MGVVIDEDRLKILLKDAFVELLEERKDIFYDIFSDVLEDVALTVAIKEGENTASVSRERIFKILEG